MLKRGNEIPTIDVAMVTINKSGGTELALQTASKITINPQTETQDSVKLIVKGLLIAQKREKTVVTGNTIVLTDNVLIPEVVKVFQGGTIKYWSSTSQDSESDTDGGFGVASYTPPLSGSEDEGEEFTLNAYSSIYDAAGLITGYEKISYPHCKGTPVALVSEDGVFRAPEYTINSAPKKGEAPYKITYTKTLPEVS